MKKTKKGLDRRQKAGLKALSVAKVERLARERLHRHLLVQKGVFTALAAVQERVLEDLLERANAYREESATMTAVHIALALQEKGCLAAKLCGTRRVAGVSLRPGAIVYRKK